MAYERLSVEELELVGGMLGPRNIDILRNQIQRESAEPLQPRDVNRVLAQAIQKGLEAANLSYRDLFAQQTDMKLFAPNSVPQKISEAIPSALQTLHSAEKRVGGGFTTAGPMR